MKQRLYIDTSVYGGYFDDEFAEHTKPLFDRLKNNEFTILFSSITQEELNNAPERVINFVKGLESRMTEFLDVTNEATELANQYIEDGVVGQSCFTDCLHIALATISKADYLISWNFKHIVNVDRIRGYNSINVKRGYKQLEIRSPREFVKYEND